MKVCIGCKQKKKLVDFYANKNNKDGFTGKCKECIKAHTAKKYRDAIKQPESKFALKSYWAEYRANQRKNGNHMESSAAPNTHRKRFPEKYAAVIATSHIIKPDGFHCHHWSYQKTHHKDIVFLKQKDHARVHRYLNYDQERKQYRRLDGILLDTKQESMQYYAYVLSLNPSAYPDFKFFDENKQFMSLGQPIEETA
jgi:hypothetical protein